MKKGIEFDTDSDPDTDPEKTHAIPLMTSSSEDKEHMALLPKFFVRNTVVLIAGVISSVIAIIYILSLRVDSFNFFRIMDLKTIDSRFLIRGDIIPGPEVVMAVIDEKSIDKEGRWAWPRSKIAALVDKLSAAGAKVIAFDIGFHEPEDQRVVQAIEQIQKKCAGLAHCKDQFHPFLEKLKSEADNDRLLATAIKQAKAKVVLGWFFHVGEDVNKLAYLNESEKKQKQEDIRFSKYAYTHLANPNIEPNLKYIVEIFPEPVLAMLSDAAGHTGYFNFRPDEDGLVRWLETVLAYNGQLYAPLSLKALSAYFDKPLYLEIGDDGRTLFTCIGDRICIPTDEKGRMMINYRGEDRLFPQFSVTDILNDKVPADELKDRIVIVGATAIGTFDLVATPFSPVFPGPCIHANVIDSILREDFLDPADYFRLIDLFIILFCGLALGLILSRVGMIPGAISSILLMGGYLYFCQKLFVNFGYVLSVVYPILTIVLIYISITAYQYFGETAKKRFIQNTFSKYLAPTVVKQLIDSPDKVVLGGEQRDITAFFSDVQGFTTISEKMSPPALVELLNEFLTEMTDIILKHEGLVDKFEGDAIIAFFGAPNVLPNNAQTAVSASLEMQTRLITLRERWQERGWPELRMRVGLNTGPAVVGNMGSKSRMSYTMMGDTVNTAARLEGVNKVYGVYLLIGESTRSRLDSNIVCREIDSINVVGKLTAITIFEPLGLQEAVSAEKLETVAQYAKGLAAYRSRDWSNAADHFKQALDMTPDDGPSKTMLKRVEEYQQNPPPPDWNGAFTMSSK